MLQTGIYVSVQQQYSTNGAEEKCTWFWGNPEGRRQFGRCEHRLDKNIKGYVKEI